MPKLAIKLDLAYKPFEHCAFSPDQARDTAERAFNDAIATLLDEALPWDVELVLWDCATRGTWSSGTNGQFWWPNKLHSACWIGVYVNGGATLADVTRTVRHEAYHYYEWVRGWHPMYDEALAASFAKGAR